MKKTNKILSAALAATLSFASIGIASAADMVLRASHQWPGGKGDVRDEMVQMIARDINKANLGLDIQVYPGKSLYKPKEQWGAIVKGTLDITAFPLAYAAGRHPEFNLTLMPGLVKNHDHAQRLNNSEFMKRIKKIMNDSGVMVLADTWLAGGFVSKKKCILWPDDVKGQTFRAAGKAFNQMLAGAGASITSMPSSEIYSGLQTGVLDGANTSSASLVSYRQLNKKQQDAILAAGKKAEKFAYEGAKEADAKLVKAYKDAGVKVVYMNEKQADAWRAIADKTSYKSFADNVKGGRELLDLALSVK